MTKTQIQVPERLFAQIKKFARQHEWSLAETFRRGAELLLEPTLKTPLQSPKGGNLLPPIKSDGRAFPRTK